MHLPLPPIGATLSSAIVLLAVVAHAQAATPQDPDLRFSIPGTLNVDASGAAQYSIPLEVPPGTNDLTPKLSLEYNSRRPNGLVGVGWSLGGLSAVTRGGPTIAQDGFVDDVDFDADDRFFLDGARLMVTNGAYGAHGTTYFLERTQGERVRSFGQVGSGPARFKVWTRSGLVLHYGRTADSRIEAQGASSVLVWAINSIEDRFGNHMSITYHEDTAAGHHRPDRIEYGGNLNTGTPHYLAVEFEYGQRGDVVSAYINGSRTSTPVRLDRVRVVDLVSGSTIKSYDLGYGNAWYPLRSRLQEIEEFDANGNSLPSTDIDYRGGTHSFGADTTWIQHFGYHQGWRTSRHPRMLADLDGDGMSDVVGFSQWGVETALSTGSGFEPYQLALSEFGRVHGWYVDRHPRTVADVNADGLPDVVGFGATGTYVALSTGSGFAASERWNDLFGFNTGWYVPDHPRFLRDVDADGRADVVGFGGDGTYVATSTGTTFNVASSWIANFGRNHGWYTNRHPRFVEDVNGDGRADIVGFSEHAVAVSLSTGSGFEPPTDWLVAFSQDHGWRVDTDVRTLADVNGDGLLDIVGFKDGVWVALNTGTSFETPTQWSTDHANVFPPPGLSLTRYCRDVNGDGLADAISVDAVQGRIVVSLSTGSTFHLANEWGVLPANFDSIRYERPVIFADTNGDGAQDFVHFDLDRVEVRTSQVTAPDLVSRISNGIGRDDLIEYLPISSDVVFTRSSGSVYPVVDLQTPLHVVRRTQSGDPSHGTLRDSTYRYNHARSHLLGRGFLGFERIRRTDGATGIATRTWYSQAFPTTGLPYQEQQNLGGITLSRIDRTWDYQADPAGPIYRPIVTRTVETSNELDGSLIKSSVTDNVHDTFGEIVQQNITTTDSSETFTENRSNTYHHDGGRWLLGRLTRAEVTRESPGRAPVTRTSTFEYDAPTGVPVVERLEPGTPLGLVTTTAYDAFGNAETVTVDGPDVAPRTTTTISDAAGRFPVQRINAAGHVETMLYDGHFGRVASHVGPNGLASSWSYDGFGRKVQKTEPAGTTTTWSYGGCNANCPPEGRSRVTSTVGGAAPITVAYDALGREVRSETLGFDGARVLRDTQYDATGRPNAVSNNYRDGSTALWTTLEYDDLGRVVSRTTPDGFKARTEYSGLTAAVWTDADTLHAHTTQRRNAMDQVVETLDAFDFRVQHVYDSVGNLIRVVDDAGNVIRMEYDLRGRRTLLDDPDLGEWTYEYDVLDQLVRQVDAKRQVTSFGYDLLGRLVERREAEGMTSWVYDTAPKGIGKLGVVRSPGDYTRFHAYDDHGRPSSISYTIGGRAYQVSQAYDAWNRLARIDYPSGFSVGYQYDARGFLREVENPATGAPYWTATAMSADGEVTSEMLGNGLETHRTYEPAMGRLVGIRTGAGGTWPVQDLEYAYDLTEGYSRGNLHFRRDHNLGLTETFRYDVLNRLISATIPQGDSTSYQYDTIGNLVFHQQVGAYDYGEGSAGPHAVTSINGTWGAIEYRYDRNGNQTLSLGTAIPPAPIAPAAGLVHPTLLVRRIEYTSYNKPALVAQSGEMWQFAYDPERSRTSTTRLTNGRREVTTHIGALYERSDSATAVEHRNYVFAGKNLVGVVAHSNSGAASTRYLHKDHLGSLDAVTDASGAVIERQSFDAFGKRRNPDWTSAALGSVFTGLDRGFTGHDHLEATGLIHMNGRLYDGVIGRFTSPDPFVQFPRNMQGLNRYSYVLNNPLSYTDPTGYFLEALSKELGDWLNHVRDQIQIAANNPGAFSLALVATALAGPAGPAVAGAIGGAVYGYVSTGTLDGALEGALVGYTVGSYVEALIERGFVEASQDFLREEVEQRLSDELGGLDWSPGAGQSVDGGGGVLQRRSTSLTRRLIQREDESVGEVVRESTRLFFDAVDGVVARHGPRATSTLGHVVDAFSTDAHRHLSAIGGAQLPGLGTANPLLEFLQDAGRLDQADNRYQGALNALKLIRTLRFKVVRGLGGD